MSHSVAGEPPAAGHRAAPSITAVYSATEWDLLTRLPAQVILAAVGPDPGRPPRGVSEGLAGLDGVAAGRVSDSDLVRAVVTTIYAEPAQSRPAVPRPVDLAEVLTACRAAVRILDRRADPADSAVYRQWVQSVATRVCRAGSDGRGPWAPPDPGDRMFLDRLGEALGLR